MDGGDLAGKVDLFLSNPRFRREVADAMCDEIRTRHRLDDLLADVIERAVARAARPSPSRRPASAVSGASVEHTDAGAVVQTAALA
jgi:hypothetical protein